MRATAEVGHGPEAAGGEDRVAVRGVRGDRDQVVGLFVSDLHLSETCPVSRAEKKTWLADTGPQARVLGDLCALQEEHDCPVFLVGDIFDRWNASAWVINFALVHLPKAPGGLFAIPGNHDLPNHSYVESFRSSYWTLVEAGRVINLTPGGTHGVGNMSISPFPCGFEVKPLTVPHSMALNVALIHEFIWTEKTGFPGANPMRRYSAWMKKLVGYDVAFFGDNHNAFLIMKEGKCSVCNCGAFIRRTSKEVSYTPRVSVLHTSGKITRHFLDVSLDQWSDTGKEIAKLESSLQMDLTGVIEEMAVARNTGYDWKRTVQAWIDGNNLNREVAEIIIRAVSEQ